MGYKKEQAKEILNYLVNVPDYNYCVIHDKLVNKDIMDKTLHVLTVLLPNTGKYIGYDYQTKELTISLSKNGTSPFISVFKGIVENEKDACKVLEFITKKYWNKENGVIEIIPEYEI